MRRALRQLISTALLLLAPLAPAAEPAHPHDHEERRINQLIIEKNDFETSRSLADYGRDLGPEFRARLSGLRAGDVWVDLGAGDQNALIQYLTMEKVQGFDLPPVEQRAKVVALSYVEPKLSAKNRKRLQQIIRQRGPDVLQELIGDFRKIPQSRFAGASVMTSNMGVISYVEDLTYSMQKSFNGLKKGGSLFIKSDVSNFQFVTTMTPSSEAVSISQSTRAIEKQLGKIPGTRMLHEPHVWIAEYSDAPVLSLSFQKTDELVETPNFRVVSFTAARPPDRRLVRVAESRQAELLQAFASEEREYIDPIRDVANSSKSLCDGGIRAFLARLFRRPIAH